MLSTAVVRAPSVLVSFAVLACTGGKDPPEGAKPNPVRVVGIERAATISASGSSTCAVDGEGAVWCWGWNPYGELGDGTTQARDAPARVMEPGSARAVSSGDTHACAVASD